MAITFKPSPGIILVEEITDSGDSLQLQLKSKNRTVKGKVKAVGPDLVTDFGTTLKTSSYAAIGDVVYFLSYEGNYDIISIDNIDYYVVKIQDLRGVLK